MAKYIHVPSLGMFTYALDECEDYVTLDAYLRLRQSGQFETSKHLRIFEYYHLERGGTLNDNILLQLNGALRRLGRPSLVFVNGHTTNFAGLRGDEKISRRNAILDHIRSLAEPAREALIRHKRDEAARLPERNPDLPRTPPADGPGLTTAEIERRRQAVSRAQQASAAQPLPHTNDPHTPQPETDFVPESTVQDNVVELIAEMQDLKREVASLKTMLQTVFRNV